MLEHYDVYTLKVTGNELCILYNALEQLNDKDLTHDARYLKGELRELIENY